MLGGGEETQLDCPTSFSNAEKAGARSALEHFGSPINPQPQRAERTSTISDGSSSAFDA
jgi:hypothetical protein